ncbi:MAG: hypothetical protein FJ253_04210 [Phycisphaerae bacterium]|nr:hypothetical protein [Phycisphaerae bacterium]
MTRFTAVAAAASAFAALFAASVGAAVAPDAPPAEYRYFKQRVALDLEPSMIAVFSDQAAAGLAALPTTPLVDAGIAADGIAASSAPGWQYAELPVELRSRAAIEALSADLLTRNAYDFVSPVFLGAGGLPVVITRDVLVALRTELPPAERTAFVAEHVPGQVLAVDFAGLEGVFHVRTPLRSAAEVLDLVNALALEPQVVFAQSDAIHWVERCGVVPNDPLFPQQWALDQPNDEDMNGPEAWAINSGDPGIVVVVLDSGIDQGHEDLSQISGMTFSGAGSNGAPSTQCDDHGTAVGGCVAATLDNGLGVVGIAPNARVRSGKIFNQIFFIFLCLPFLESQDSWTVNGIMWAQSSGARVTNSSWGGGTPSAAVTTAFDTTRSLGVIHFAAAGNGGTSSISYPANLPSINAVAAISSTGALASFSQYGSGLFISAPGATVLTTDRMGSAGYASGNYATVDGTSFASPYAAGVAALVLSVNPALTPDEVESIMAASAKDRGLPGYDTTFGWGIADAFAAVVAAQKTLGNECPADFDRTGTVDGDDLGSLLGQWGACPDCAADFNDDGTVDGDDLGGLLGAWGACP